MTTWSEQEALEFARAAALAVALDALPPATPTHVDGAPPAARWIVWAQDKAGQTQYWVKGSDCWSYIPGHAALYETPDEAERALNRAIARGRKGAEILRLPTAEEFAAFRRQPNHMRPVIARAWATTVETNNGSETVPADVALSVWLLLDLGMMTRGNPPPESHEPIEVPPGHPRHADLCMALPLYLEGDLDEEQTFTLKVQYLARMSAPGYLDCTGWTAHDTEEQAQRYLLDTYAG